MDFAADFTCISMLMYVNVFFRIQNAFLKGGVFPTNRNTMENHPRVCLEVVFFHIISHTQWAFSRGNNDEPLGVWVSMVFPTCSDPYHDYNTEATGTKVKAFW